MLLHVLQDPCAAPLKRRLSDMSGRQPLLCGFLCDWDVPSSTKSIGRTQESHAVEFNGFYTRVAHARRQRSSSSPHWLMHVHWTDSTPCIDTIDFLLDHDYDTYTMHCFVASVSKPVGTAHNSDDTAQPLTMVPPLGCNVCPLMKLLS